MKTSIYKIAKITFSLLFFLINIPTGWAASWPEPIFIKVVENLDQPVHLTHAGDNSGDLFIVEQSGKIQVLKGNDTQQQLFLDITDRVLSGGERGLLSVAFPPDYKNKKYFYVNYTNTSGNTTISRFHLETNKNIANAQSEEIILTVDQPFSNHNGGQLAFGPEGFLYIGMGDGGSGGDPLGSGQNGNTLLGKMLRIDVESDIEPYAIPNTNPFLTTEEFRPEIWALGLRNPWRFSFDSKTGDLYIADVGQDQFEEVNFQFANSSGGDNYGWNTLEGFHCFNSQTCNQNNLTAPVTEYDHSQGDVSITGGLVYRGNEFPRMQSVYFFADFASGRLAGLRRENNQWESSVLAKTNFNISSFGEDGAGQIYLVDISGSIYRIEDKIRLNHLEFEGLQPQYMPGANLQLSIKETNSKRTTPTALWVALQPPDGNLLYLTSNPTQSLTAEPIAFIKQVDTRTNNHHLLSLKIPAEIAQGLYTFYAIYNEVGTDLNNLPLTLRSNLSQSNTVVVKKSFKLAHPSKN